MRKKDPNPIMFTKVSPFGGGYSGVCVFFVEVRSSWEEVHS